jgi:hypothetical protein
MPNIAAKTCYELDIRLAWVLKSVPDSWGLPISASVSFQQYTRLERSGPGDAIYEAKDYVLNR